MSRIAALVLAAGRSSRMGANKLLIETGGRRLVERAVDAALASRAASVTIVLGHDAAALRAVLAGRPAALVENPHHAQGLGSSLRAGIAALGPDSDGAVVCLADMPEVGPALIDRLIEAYDPDSGIEIAAPVRDGRRGNPVLWGRCFFPALMAIDGDAGARHLIERHADRLARIDWPDETPFIDLDTPEALARWRSDSRD